MSVIVTKDITIGKIICCQLILCLIASIILLCFKDLFWALSGFTGGMVVCLPNSIFLLISHNIFSRSSSKTLSGSHFITGWIVKLLFTIVLLVLAIHILNVAMLPFCVVILLMLIVYVLAPILIKKQK